jgi:hypothetical protein
LSAIFSSFNPTVRNSGVEVSISLPIGNTGSTPAPGVFVTGISFGSAARISPAGFPVFLGDLAVSNNVSVDARFSSTGLVIGNRYLMTVRGVYGSGAVILAFTVNRFIVVPAVSAPPVTFLQATAEVSITPNTWTYTLYNDEPATSTLYIGAFSLDLVAPVTIANTPDGWSADTDNRSYVLWYAADQQLPYPHQVSPGGSLGGFQLQSVATRSESTRYALASWDHQSNGASLVSFDYVLSPSPPP